MRATPDAGPSPADGGGDAALTPALIATDAGTQDAFIAHNVAAINQYRAMSGLSPYTLDATISVFALAGATELSIDHLPHQHFMNAEANKTLFAAGSGFKTAAGENQGDPNGWPVVSSDPSTNETTQIDQILAAMMAEGPTGGHYQNIMSAKYTRVGVGLLEVSNKLYLCNDFSN